MWMWERPPAVAKRKDVVALLRKYLKDVPDGAFDKEEPKPCTVVGIGMQDFGPFAGDDDEYRAGTAGWWIVAAATAVNQLFPACGNR